jgi:hypothetical protein
MERKHTTITIPALIGKEYGRDGGWGATVAGIAVGYAPTQREAKERASRTVLELASNAATMPAMVRDDDGAVWVFTAHGSGHVGSRIRPGAESASIGTTYGEGTPEEAAERIVRHHAGAVRIG